MRKFWRWLCCVFQPHTPESVLRELISGLRNGTIVITDEMVADPEPSPMKAAWKRFEVIHDGFRSDGSMQKVCDFLDQVGRDNIIGIVHGPSDYELTIFCWIGDGPMK